MNLETLIGTTVLHQGKTYTLKKFWERIGTPLFKRDGCSLLWELEGYDLAWARRRLSEIQKVPR